MGDVAKTKTREVISNEENPRVETIRHLEFSKDLERWPHPDPDLAPVDLSYLMGELRMWWNPNWFDAEDHMVMPPSPGELWTQVFATGMEILVAATAYLNLYPFEHPPSSAKLRAAKEENAERSLSPEKLWDVVDFMLREHQV